MDCGSGRICEEYEAVIGRYNACGHYGEIETGVF